MVKGEDNKSGKVLFNLSATKLNLSDFKAIINDFDLVIKYSPFLLDEEYYQVLSSAEIIEVKKGSIEFVLLVCKYTIVLKAIKKLVSETKELVEEINNLASSLFNLFFDLKLKFRNSEEKIRKDELEKLLSKLNRRISVLNHMYSLIKKCHEKKAKISVTFPEVKENYLGRNRFIIDDRTYRLYSKYLRKESLQFRPQVICGTVKELEIIERSKYGKFKARINLLANFNLQIYFNEVAFFERLKTYLSPDSRTEKLVKLKVKPFIEIDRYKRIDKAYLIDVIGDC